MSIPAKREQLWFKSVRGLLLTKAGLLPTTAPTPPIIITGGFIIPGGMGMTEADIKNIPVGMRIMLMGLSIAVRVTPIALIPTACVRAALLPGNQAVAEPALENSKDTERRLKQTRRIQYE